MWHLPLADAVGFIIVRMSVVCSGCECAHFQLEGSVDEGSTKSDEEYDDLAMEDMSNSGYISDDEYHSDKVESNEGTSRGESRTHSLGEKYRKKLDLLKRTRSVPLSKSHTRSSSPTVRDKNEKRFMHSGSHRLRNRSMSMPRTRDQGSPPMNSPQGEEAANAN